MVTVLTRTIGPSGRDYASFTLAEADVTNIGTSADLVANDEAIVFEADAGSYNERLSANSTLTTDATRNVTYKAAAGSEHDGSLGSGVYLNLASSDVAQVYDAHVNLRGITISGTAYTISAQTNSHGLVVDSCVVYSSATLVFQPALQVISGNAASPTTVTNTVLITDGIPYCARIFGDVALRNCTTIGGVGVRIEAGTKNIGVEVTNHLSLGSSSYQATVSTGSITLSGSNNFGGSTDPFPVAIQGSPYPITPTTSFSTPLGSGDYAVYMGATGALADVTGNDVWQQGVGPASNSDVPTTDINGVTRSGTSCNPGAFEADGFVAPTVLTRTIGSGKDYSTFTLAEAAVTSIGSGTDLTFYNEAIVFEADAATYNESVTVQSTLTTDATRQVTYKPAAGSEHGGDRTTGVIIDPGSGNAFRVFDAFTGVEGLVFAGWLQLNEDGCIADSCISLALFPHTAIVNGPAGTALHPVEFRNCVLEGTATNPSLNLFSNTGDVTAQVVNCTFTNAGVTAGTATGTTVALDIVNSLVLASGSGDLYQQGAGTHILTGSNNYGPGTTHAFPAAIQGTPYPITATTDTSPGAGDWAIYQASNGQLYNIVANDVWQQGVGPTANSDVPATDILGVARYGATANPGAFELGLPVPGIRVKPRHFQVNTAATAHAVSVWQPQLRKL